MSQSNLPDLSHSTAQLLADNDRIVRFTDGLPSRVDRIVAAALEDDWSEVRRLAEFMIRPIAIDSTSDISASARQLCSAIDKPNNRVDIQQSLLRLICACGTASSQAPSRAHSMKSSTDTRVR